MRVLLLDTVGIQATRAALGDRPHDVTYENRTADPSRRGGKTVENVVDDENCSKGKVEEEV